MPDDHRSSATFDRQHNRMRHLAGIGSWLAAVLAACLLPSTAAATEGGNSNKALGVDTVLTGVMPPPGMRLTSYLGYYTADETLDGNGNPRPNISNFHVNATAMTLRFQYVYPNAKLFGADIETRVGLTLFADVDVHFDVKTPGGQIHRSGAANGDFPGGLFAPVLLGWHGETVHQIAGFEAFFPAREFHPNQLANISSGYWSVAPAYWITWLPNDLVDVSGSFVYLYNFENDKTNYKSGQEFGVDWGLGFAVTPAWQTGLNGYFYQQTTDDSLNGNDVPGGNRGRAAAIGPFLRFHPSRDFGITLKWQKEFAVENRASGNRFFLQLSAQLW
jgi:hypothetical protein